MYRTALKALLCAGLLFFLLGSDCQDLSNPVAGTVNGVVTVEGEPLAGVRVALIISRSGDHTLDEATTGPSGLYVFPDVVDGDYTVALSSYPEDVKFDPSYQTVSMPRDGTTQSADFDGEYIRTSSILGMLSFGITGIEDVTVTRVGPDGQETTTSASDGTYSFVGLRSGEHTVSIPDDMDPDLTCDEGCSHTVTLGVDEDYTQDFPCTWAEASVEITSITDAAGSEVNEVTPVAGLLTFGIVAVDGMYTGESISLTIDGEVAATVPFARETTISVRTDRLEGSTSETELLPEDLEADGTVARGQFPNGSRAAAVTLKFDSGETLTPEESKIFEAANPDRLLIFPGCQQSSACLEADDGTRWCGGDDIPICASPLLYCADCDVGSLSIEATAGTQTASGSGTITLDQTTDAEAPFIFTIPAASNAGGPEDLAGAPDGPGGLGSEITVTEVLDQTGASVLSSFEDPALVDLFVDFDGPDGTGEIAVGRYPELWEVIDGHHFYSGSADNATWKYILYGTPDDGAGGAFDATTDNLELDLYAMGYPATMVQSDVGYTGDASVAAQSESRVYAVVTGVRDRLGNEAPDVSIFEHSEVFRFDFVAPMVTVPSGDPPVITGSSFDLRIVDASFAMNKGSGVNWDGCTTDCSQITASVVSGPAGAPSTLVVRHNPAALVASYDQSLSVGWDPSGHDPFIFNAASTYPSNLPITLTVTVLDGDPTGIRIEGPSPWVTVEGTLVGDNVETTGTGTVAGNDGIAVSLEGDLQAGGVYGFLELGLNGGLPGGSSILYYLWPGSPVDAEAPDLNDFIVELPDGMPNGTYTVLIEAPDYAYLEPNTSSVQFEFVLQR